MLLLGFCFSIVPFKITSRFQRNGGMAQKALQWKSAPYIVREQIKTFQNRISSAWTQWGLSLEQLPLQNHSVPGQAHTSGGGSLSQRLSRHWCYLLP